MLGVEESDTSFDRDVTFHINSAIMVLTQLGVGPTAGFRITDKTQTWVNFIGTRLDLESVKSFIYIKVRLIFDPPTNATLLEAFRSELKEQEWRINTQLESFVEEVV